MELNRRRFLAPVEALQLAFERFGENGEILRQRGYHSERLYTDYCGGEGFSAWEFRGDRKSVEIGGVVYDVRFGRIHPTPENEQMNSLWVKEVPDSPSKGRGKKEKRKILSENSFLFAEAHREDIWERARQIRNPQGRINEDYPDTIVLAGRTHGPGYHPPEEVDGEFARRTINLREASERHQKRFGSDGSIVVYKSGVVDYMLEEMTKVHRIE